MPTYTNSFEEFLVQHRFTPNRPIIPGRFARDGSRWCLLFDDSAGGMIGSFKDAEKYYWFTNKTSSRKNISFNVQKLAKQRDVLREKRFSRYKTKGQEARKIFERSRPAPVDHSYLMQKAISHRHLGNNVFRMASDGRLLVPLRRVDGDIVNLQFINEYGIKRPLQGAQYSGVYCIVQFPNYFDLVVICEGVATACTVSDTFTNALVVAALGTTNLESISQIVRIRYPAIDITIAGDDDRATAKRTGTNPGKKAAERAARRVAAKTIYPLWPANAPFDLTDFNDLHVWEVVANDYCKK